MCKTSAISEQGMTRIFLISNDFDKKKLVVISQLIEVDGLALNQGDHLGLRNMANNNLKVNTYAYEPRQQ